MAVSFQTREPVKAQLSDSVKARIAEITALLEQASEEEGRQPEED
jgi:hypothetical protein